jgi:hypothetical protein
VKASNLGRLGLAGAFFTLAITGCDTGGDGANGFTGNIKSQGVYTTLAVFGEGLDLPGSGYFQKGSFGPGETPAAVIAGYGDYNQVQLVSLQLIESGTGRSLFSKDYYAAYGKVFVQPLAIRLSGNYELKLTTGGSKLDSCQFTVTRTNSSATLPVPDANSGAKYAEGVFSVAMEPDNSSGLFDEYDGRLIQAMLNSVTEAAGSTNRELFAQRFPGKVVMQCRLDFQGRLTGPKILENSLDAECGGVFAKALLDRSPYAVWTEDAHQKAGSDYRTLTVTVRYE